MASPEEFNDPYDCSLSLNSPDGDEYPDYYDAQEAAYAAYAADPDWGTSSSTTAVQPLEKPDIPKLIAASRRELLISCFNVDYSSPAMWAHYAAQHKGYCVEYALTDLRDELKDNLYPVRYGNERVSLLATALVSALSKALDWQYEREWRIVLPARKERRLPIAKPRRILLGSRICERDARELCSIGEQHDIPVFYTHLQLVEYRIEVAPHPVPVLGR